jgi:hypothetical protein
MRLSRHAKNEMRMYGIGPEDVEATIADPVARDVDDRGNARLPGETGDHRPILVVVAGDDPRLRDHRLPSDLTMRADYDSTANAISIAITNVPHADESDVVHSRAIVALADGKPVEVQLLYPDMGIGEPLAAVADRYDLDGEALHAAAQSALAAPDRVVTLEVEVRARA